MSNSARLGTWLGLVAVLALSVVTALPAQAQRDDNPVPRKKNQDNPTWNDPTVSGIVTSTFWAEGKDAKSKTATIVVWSDDANLAGGIYPHTPTVRAAIVNGTACVGRYVVATGDRLDSNQLSAQGIVVPNLDMECTAT